MTDEMGRSAKQEAVALFHRCLVLLFGLLSLYKLLYHGVHWVVYLPALFALLSCCPHTGIVRFRGEMHKLREKGASSCLHPLTLYNEMYIDNIEVANSL